MYSYHVRFVFCALFLLGTHSNALLAESATTYPSAFYDVRSFGAIGDGVALDTPAINKAIEAAAAAGGGTVFFPAGKYLSVTIHLKSNIALYINPGATIIAATTSKDVAYDPPEPNPSEAFQDFGHNHWNNSLISGQNLENVSILGQGRIFGKGLTRSHRLPSDPADKTIGLKLCHNVQIRDISILQGGHFAILATGVDNLTVDNVKIDTNRDGLDIDCCRNVRISNCSVNSPFDDGICLKSSYALGVARATENVTITNCQVSGYDEGTFLDGTFLHNTEKGAGPVGRIKLGTESMGGFRNITISNCVFDHCHGLALETVDGAALEDVTVSNLTMRDLVDSPIFLRLGSRMRSPRGTRVGSLRHVMISNVVADNADPRFGSIISGVPGHDIEDVKLSNIRISYRGGGTREQATTQPAEIPAAYPESLMFGEIPSYGFFIRHVKGIEISSVEVNFMKEDLRPAFVLHNVSGAYFHNIKAQHAVDVPMFDLKDVSDFSLYQGSGIPDVRRDHADREQF